MLPLSFSSGLGVVEIVGFDWIRSFPMGWLGGSDLGGLVGCFGGLVWLDGLDWWRGFGGLVGWVGFGGLVGWVGFWWLGGFLFLYQPGCQMSGDLVWLGVASFT